MDAISPMHTPRIACRDMALSGIDGERTSGECMRACVVGRGLESGAGGIEESATGKPGHQSVVFEA